MNQTIARRLTMPVDVVVVDDDDINRRGMATLLSESKAVGTVIAATHAEAESWSREWTQAKVVVVDAADERCEFDQFPGVTIVERVRQHTNLGQSAIVVVTEHFYDDAVRRRMREARADFFYHRNELRNAEALYDAVLSSQRSGRTIPPPMDPEAEFRLGVNAATRVNRAVAFAARYQLDHALRERVDPRSRRWQRLRAEFNKEARLTPVTTDGRRPDRIQNLPSIPQIMRFLNWATKIKPVHATPSDFE